MLSSNSSSVTRSRFVQRVASVAIAVGAIAACSDSTSPASAKFLNGTSSDREIGVVVNSTGKALTLFQLGNPTNTEEIALGTSSTVTPTGLNVRGQYALVPLGNAASVAYINLPSASVARYFLFRSGNATGSAFVNDTLAIVANTNDNYVGRINTRQVGDTILDTVAVAGGPTAVAVAGNRVLIVSSNLDENYLPAGNGIVTAIDPMTMQVLGTVSTGGTDATDAAVGPDGLLYVVNTGDYNVQGNLTIIDPSTLQVVTTVPNMGVGAGAISIDSAGLAYISGFYSGTIVWNTKTRQFVRDSSNPLCAPIAAGGCRGAFAATSDAAGDVYQVFFGSTTNNLPPYVFVYNANTFALSDSVSVGVGPSAIAIRKF